MKEIGMAVLFILVFTGIGSCAHTSDLKMCQFRGEQLGAEVRWIDGRCAIKGWSTLR